jgi:O-antigen/teichoic acid export membrane protein
MREELATSGAVIIIIGLLYKSFIVSSNPHQYVSPNLAYPILGAGFILLMYGFVGWQRMMLQRPGWIKPISAIIIVETSIAACAYLGLPWWRYIAVGVVVLCILLMDLLLLGYAIRQRFYVASPFLVLHMVASCITAMIDLNAHNNTRIIQGSYLPPPPVRYCFISMHA